MFDGSSQQFGVSKDIAVRNQTDDNSIIVLVFARPYPIPLTEETFKMAWKIMLIQSGGTRKFSYPAKNQISVFYYNTDGRSRVTAGPVDAEPGTTWHARAIKNGSILLEKGAVTSTIITNYLWVSE